MKTGLPAVIAIAVVTSLAAAAVAAPAPTEIRLDAAWLTGKPEVLTYRTTSPQGDGVYQLTIATADSVLELGVNIVTPGFSKQVSTTTSRGLRPLRGQGRILVQGQVEIATRTDYSGDSLEVATIMKPYGREMNAALPYTGQVVDPGQSAFMTRFLPLAAGTSFEFSSLDPQHNQLVPYTVRVTGDGMQAGVACWRAEVHTFEGESIDWIEKAAPHRIMRIEQPADHRVTELIP